MKVLKCSIIFGSSCRKCLTFSNMMIGFMACNGLWVIASIIGFRSINSKQLKYVKRYYILLWIIFLTENCPIRNYVRNNAKTLYKRRINYPRRYCLCSNLPRRIIYFVSFSRRNFNLIFGLFG